MSFLYIRNATYLNPDHVIRIRATKVPGQCELITVNNSVYVSAFDYLERSQASLSQVPDKLREYEEQMQKRVTDRQRQTTPRDERSRSTREDPGLDRRLPGGGLSHWAMILRLTTGGKIVLRPRHSRLAEPLALPGPSGEVRAEESSDAGRSSCFAKSADSDFLCLLVTAL